MAAAIPLIVGAVVSSVVAKTAIGATVLFGAVTVATVVGAVASSVVGSAVARRQEKKMSAAAQAGAANAAAANAAAARLRDVQSVVRSAIEPQRIVYGRALVGGTLPFWFVSGDLGQFHHWAQTLAGHQIDGVDAYYVGDDPVTVDGNGWVTTPQYCRGGTVPLIRLRLYTGTQTTLDADLVAASAGALTAADAGRGMAYLYVRWEADFDVFGQTGAPTIRAVVRGKPLFDPRTGQTVFADNAALAVRDYLTSHQGLRCTTAEVNNADVIAAANICDEIIPLAGGATQRRYTVNGALSCGDNLKDNLETLTDAMAGMAAWTQGQWSVQAGAWQVPVGPGIGVDDIISVEEVIAFTPRRELFNTVTGTYIEPGEVFAAKQFPAVTNAGYVAQDGGHVVERDLTLPLCNDGVRAQRMAKIELERARQAVTASLLCKWTTYDLRPGSHVAVTIPRYGWAGKTFFVADRTLSADGIRYVLRETAPQVWAWNMGEATAIDPAPNTSLPNPFVAPAVTSLAAHSGTGALQIAGDGTVISRIRLSWATLISPHIQTAGRIEIEYRPVGATDWVSARADGSEAATYLGPVEDGIVYEVRARAVNSTGQRGTWASITHTVVGKTEPPPNVTGLTISGDTLNWAPIEGVADLAGYVVRFHYGNNPWWPTATPLHDGVITQSPWTMITRPAGPVTLMVKALDTSGNTSLQPAAIITDLGDPLVDNVLLSWPQAPTWPGTITGASVAAGALRANETDSFYGPTLAAFYGASEAPRYVASTFGDMEYAFGFVNAASGHLTLLHNINGLSRNIEFQRENQNARYGSPSDLFYAGAGPDPFYGPPSAWATWPGALVLTLPERIAFRVRVAGGSQRGSINLLTAVLDVPDVLETIADAVVPAGGSRLPITQSYRQIVNVQITLQDDGNNGRTALIIDKNPAMGPSVIVLNAAGASVPGRIDATVQGF